MSDARLRSISGGSLQLKAVSGMAALPLGDITVERLNQLMRWLSSQTELLYLRQDDAEGEKQADLPAPVAEYFAATGFRGLYAIPLADDQGRVGVLTYESSDPDFLDVPHIEMIKILAGQATVAIRNALLYREVPLISLIEPLVRKKRALLNNRRGSWMAIGILFECALFLSFFPLPMRLAGDAVVAPQHLVTIAAPVDGNVTAVLCPRRAARGRGRSSGSDERLAMARRSCVDRSEVSAGNAGDAERSCPRCSAIGCGSRAGGVSARGG